MQEPRRPNKFSIDTFIPMLTEAIPKRYRLRFSTEAEPILSRACTVTLDGVEVSTLIFWELGMLGMLCIHSASPVGVTQFTRLLNTDNASVKPNEVSEFLAQLPYLLELARI